MNSKNFVVRFFAVIINTIAQVIVIVFDGIKETVDHANPSFFGLVATLLPFVLPLPVALMTANSTQKFFMWDAWAANVLGFGLEGLGLLAYVRFVDFVLERVRSNNTKISFLLVLYGVVCIVYEVLLIFVNVILARNEGAGWDFVIILTCVCLLPALSALLYGAHRQVVEKQLAVERVDLRAAEEKRLQEQREQEEKLRQEQRELEERRYQEKRQDRISLQQMKLQYQSEVDLGELVEVGKSGRGKKQRRE